jgi:hypothetical protein
MQISVAILVGVNRVKGYIEKLIKSFKERVLSSGGTFVDQSRLTYTLTYLNTIGLLKKATLITTVNGYAVGKIFSVIPNTTSGDLTFARSTVATLRGKLGYVEDSPINTPRFYYKDGQSYPYLICEPLRTNSAINSANPALYFTSQSTVNITPTSTTNPKGNIATIDKLVTSGVSSTVHYARAVKTGKTIGLSYTTSIFVKAAGYNTMVYGNIGSEITVDLVNGLITDGEGTIERFTDGWFRISVTQLAVTTTVTTYIYPNTNTAFIGNGVDGIYIWGTQAEVGTYPTTLIETTTTALHRASELISNTNLLPFLGQQEGVIFIDGNLFSNESQNISITLSDGTISNRLQIQFQNSAGTSLNIFSFVNSVEQTPGFSYIFDMTQPFKLAILYTDGLYTLFVNGVAQVDANGGTWGGVDSLTSLYLGTANGLAQQFDGVINGIELYNTALTTVQLTQLTTLN